jgi:hypothetical protein
MLKPPTLKKPHTLFETQILGIRLPHDLAREVKAEAGLRGMKLNSLFEEMWALYRSKYPSNLSENADRTTLKRQRR